MSEANWHYSVAGKSFGPMTQEDVVAKVRGGELKATDYVWHEGMANWATLDTVAEFQAAVEAAAPPAPQAAPSPPAEDAAAALAAASAAAAAPAAAPAAGPAARPAARRCHEIDYEIFGDDMQVVEVELDPGEVVIAEAGVMNYMDDGISFEARFGDGSKPEAGFWGKLVEAGKRKLTGESLFLTHFTNAGTGKKRVAFAAPYPGRIVALNLGRLGGEIICQKDAFLCAAMGTEVGIAFAKRLGTGLFGGEGFILQRLRGDGLAFVHAGGTIIKRQLAGEKILVDTGCLVAFTPGVAYSIERAGNLKSMIFGGEGLFLATLQGAGTVWLQTLPLSRLAGRIVAGAAGSKGEGSILGGIATAFES